MHQRVCWLPIMAFTSPAMMVRIAPPAPPPLIFERACPTCQGSGYSIAPMLSQMPQGAGRDLDRDFQPVLAGFIEIPRRHIVDRAIHILHERMTQTGTPPPIRIAGTGFRGPGSARKSQSPAYRTQIGRPEFLVRCFQDWLPIAAASRFGRESRTEIVRERELPTADIPGSMVRSATATGVQVGLIDRQWRDGYLSQNLHCHDAGSCLHRLARGPTRGCQQVRRHAGTFAPAR